MRPKLTSHTSPVRLAIRRPAPAQDVGRPAAVLRRQVAVAHDTLTIPFSAADLPHAPVRPETKGHIVDGAASRRRAGLRVRPCPTLSPPGRRRPVANGHKVPATLPAAVPHNAVLDAARSPVTGVHKFYSQSVLLHSLLLRQ